MVECSFKNKVVLGSIPVPAISESHDYQEGVYVTIGNAAFCLTLHLTGVHFRGELHLTGDVSEWKIKYARSLYARRQLFLLKDFL